MAHVVCLIADPEGAALDQALVREVARALHSQPHWLAEGQACELPVENGAPETVLGRARAAVGDGQPFDVALVAAAGRPKRLLVSDMDGTLIVVECIDELAARWGVAAEVAAITRRAMNGELAFEEALRARVALLEGLPVAVFDEVYKERVRLMPGARTLVRTMASRGAVTALVSGGFVPFARRLGAELGFDAVQANRLETRDGRLTGRVLTPIRGPSSKAALLRRLAGRHQIPHADTLAVGDGANDLPMLATAGLGVAFRAHPRVVSSAPLAIRWGDLTAVLYLQGIARDEFVTS